MKRSKCRAPAATSRNGWTTSAGTFRSTALSPDCATALGEAAANALANSRPYLAMAHCVRDGLVRTYDVLALPTSSRWGGTLIGAYVNERGPAV